MSQQHRKEAIKELIFRYRATWEFWWQHRNEIKILDLKAQEAEFLPSALAVCIGLNLAITLDSSG